MQNGRPRKRATATTARLAPRRKGFEKSRFWKCGRANNALFHPLGSPGLCARMTRTSREVVSFFTDAHEMQIGQR